MQASHFQSKPIPKLLFTMAMPAILANLVNSLYNIVDQIFIGHSVGYLGNAATSVAFPLTIICLAFGLTFGLGGASNFNLSLGRGKVDQASKVVGNAISLSLLMGLLIGIFVILFLKPLLLIFGATEATMAYAQDYTSLSAFGIPFLLFTMSVNPLVRADGSPNYSMMAIIFGAVLNTILVPIFIFYFGWGIKGAAIATLISQILSAIYMALYFRRFKSVKLVTNDFKINSEIVKAILSVGSSSFIFQFSTLLIQIVTNNMLRRFGADSIYGSDIAIAVAGIVMKINSLFIAIIIGLVQGAQPIIGYNYGAKNLNRVKETTKLLLKTATIISIIAFLSFEIFTKPFLEIFGTGSKLYFQFGIKYVRVFLFFVFINGIQIASTTFFQAIGKARIGAFLSLMKQVIFLLPLLIILPHYMGVEGVMYAGPISDLIAFLSAFYFLKREFQRMPQELRSERA
ncbi:MATE family efflux transporter [Streptococcus porcinus]|uniref:Multidrug export protein MepA n=1 Tax=Streptococcus porcinus TaxID=1340 RepID=A0A4V0H210_STRPO|nr:MATE family efflux transporter [Streptococcus porcinus]VTT42086.1 MATE family efflux protein [Streptococcus porcinus]VTT43521.1 MATE family efflux protein [Streptococcus porcinus]